MRFYSLLSSIYLAMHIHQATANIPTRPEAQPDTSAFNTQTSLTSKPACVVYPVRLQTWDELRIDDYIRSFPGARQMRLEDFVFFNKVSNFVCGLGENCLAGQQCSPFQSQLWFVLYALQEWNFYVNSLYEAVTAAITQVRDIAADMISDFLIEPDQQHEQTVGLAIAITSIAATSILGFTLGFAGPALFPALGIATEASAASGATAGVATGAVIVKRSLPKTSTDTHQDGIKFPDITSEDVQRSDANLSQQMKSLNEIQTSTSQNVRLRIIHAQGSGDGLAVMDDDDLRALKLQRSIRDSLIHDSAWAGWIAKVVGCDEQNRKSKALRKRDSKRVTPYPQSSNSQSSRLNRRAPAESVPTSHFGTWTKVNTYLTSFRDHLRAVIAVTCQIGISSPIGSDEGIWGILMGGKFMTPNPSQSLLQDQTRETAKLSALAQVLKAMNVFVTIGSDKCDGQGPGGAWLGPEYLSYCDPDGLMLNLVRGAGKRTVNKIVNADLIMKKYEYSVEFLAQSAWACQEGNLNIDGRPKPIGLKTGSKVGCTFDLPVCDTRINEVAHLRREGETTVVACRKGLSLNI